MNPSSPAFFETKYRQTPDPWDFAHNPEELRRYEAILTALQGRRFRRAFEPGCSVGVLTEQLATLCDSVDASDFSQTAVATAQERCAHLPNVHITCAALSQTTSIRDFDLVVLSEIGYYFPLQDWQRIVKHLVAGMPSGATLVACHWLGHSVDHQLSGDQVHEVLLAESTLHPEGSERHPTFRLNTWVRL